MRGDVLRELHKVGERRREMEARAVITRRLGAQHVVEGGVAWRQEIPINGEADGMFAEWWKSTTNPAE